MQAAERGEGSSATHADAEKPWIFLSHSGGQKPFVEKLYLALLHAKHRPFFDMDATVSLPICRDYTSRIFEACQACKMGVVVLSEDYVQNLWPMIELQHLVHGHGSSDRLIYPLFYNLQPSDLSDPNKLARWEESWARQAAEWQWEDTMLEVQEFMASYGCEIQINLDINSWSNNLKELKLKSGEVRRKVICVNNERTFQDRSELEYIEAIVSKICAALPAPRPLDAAIKGGQRLHQEMAKVFEKDESLGPDGVRTVGVYGIGGSGKSTLCKAMATFYSNEFGGRCYHLQFPMEDNEVEKLLQNIKAILPALALHSASKDNVCTIDEALNLLDEGLRAKKVFLAIDNVWDNEGHHSFDYAQRTMLMKCMRGSKILVTSRSKEVVTRLLFQRSSSLHMQEGNTMNEEDSMTRACPGNIVHVPCLTEEEAVQALKFYSCISYLIPEYYLWRSLARSCFFAGQCHPLYLKLKGVGLRTKGRPSFNNQQWKELFSSLEISDTISCEDEVWRAVDQSLKMLSPHLQDFFIDLATTWEVDNELSRNGYWGDGWSRLELVRYQYDNYCTKDAMSYAVHELEYHGLLEFELVEIFSQSLYNVVTYKEKLIIHDLHRELASSKASSGGHANALINHAQFGDLSLVSPSAIASKKLVLGYGLKASSLLGSSKLANMKASTLTTLLKHVCTNPGEAQVQTRVLAVRGSMKSDWISGPVRRLNLKGPWRSMEALRALVLNNIKGVREIKGWEGVPNLVRLDLLLLHDLKEIGSLGHLKLLETFTLEDCAKVQLQALVGDPCKRCLVTVDDHLPKLQVLDVSWNYHVEELGSRFTDAFPALRTLRLRECRNLKSISDLSKAGSTLQILDLHYARSLKSIMEGGISSLTALQHLNLADCSGLERIPDLSNLMGLRSFDVAGCHSLS